MGFRCWSCNQRGHARLEVRHRVLSALLSFLAHADLAEAGFSRLPAKPESRVWVENSTTDHAS